MARSFLSRLRSLGVTIDDEDEFGDVLSDACEELLGMMPAEVLLGYAEEATDSGSGIALIDATTKRGYRVLEAYKGSYLACELSYEDQRDYLDGDLSLDSTDPRYYRKGGLIYIVPGGGTLVRMPFPEMARTDTAVTLYSGVDMPRLFTVALAHLAAYNGKLRETNALLDDLPSTLSLPTAPAAPSAPAFTYIGPSSTAGTATTIGTLPSLAAYSGPSLTLTSEPAITDFSTALSAPTAPSAPTFAYAAAALGALAPTAIAALPAAPAYTPPALLPTTAPTVGAFTLSATAPTAPALVGGALAALPAVPTYTPVATAEDYTDFDTYFGGSGGEDPELAQLALGRVRSSFEKAQNDLRDSLQAFNKEVVVFQETLKRNLDVANLARTDDRLAIEKLSSEVALYRAEVESEIAAYQADLALQLRLYEAERGTSISAFSAEVGSARAAFDASLAAYRAAVERNSLQAQITAQEAQRLFETTSDVNVRNAAETVRAEAEQYQAKLSLLTGELALYGDSFQVELATWQANATKDLDVARLAREGELGKFGLDLTNAQQLFSSGLAEYQAGVQKALDQARLDQERLLSDAARTDEVALQNALQDKARAVESYAAELERHRAQVSAYGIETQRAVAELAELVRAFRTKVAEIERKAQELYRLFSEKYRACVRSMETNISVPVQAHEF